MKNALILALALSAQLALADNYVRPYIKKDGTYVEGHYKSGPDRNPYNNYSSQGNSNPYTGQQGTRDPYQVQQQYQYPTPTYNGGFYNPYDSNSQPRSRW